MAEKMAHEYTSRDVRALIDERDALRARVSALEAELKENVEDAKTLADFYSGCCLFAYLGRLASPAPQVPDGYVLMELGIRPQYQVDAAVRDFRIMRQVGANEEQCVAAAIEGALLSAAQAKEGKP